MSGWEIDRRRLLLLLAENNFPIEFLNLFLQDYERFTAVIGQQILFPVLQSSAGMPSAFEPPAFFKSCEQRIHGSGTDLIAMAPQLLDHPLPNDGVLGGVVQDVDFPESEQDFPLKSFYIDGGLTVSHIT
jgi:hypothetical protein